MPAGRPSKYKAEFAEQAAGLCKLGATDANLADFFDVSTVTIDNWKGQHPEFLKSLKAAKESADQRVERRLYERATGYSHDAIKIFQFQGQAVTVPYREHVPPDTTAAIFWLKNRKPKEWRDKTEVEHVIPSNLMDKIDAKPRGPAKA